MPITFNSVYSESHIFYFTEVFYYSLKDIDRKFIGYMFKANNFLNIQKWKIDLNKRNHLRSIKNNFTRYYDTFNLIIEIVLDVLEISTK